jgi:hypothetical protein
MGMGNYTRERKQANNSGATFAPVAPSAPKPPAAPAPPAGQYPGPVPNYGPPPTYPVPPVPGYGAPPVYTPNTNFGPQQNYNFQPDIDPRARASYAQLNAMIAEQQRQEQQARAAEMFQIRSQYQAPRQSRMTLLGGY